MLKYLIPLLIMDLSMALLARYSYETGSNWALMGSVLCLMGAAVFFIKLLDYKLTVLANAIWIGFGTTLIALASYVFFGEEISLLQVFGMAIIVTGLVLTSYEPSKKTA